MTILGYCRFVVSNSVLSLQDLYLNGLRSHSYEVGCMRMARGRGGRGRLADLLLRKYLRTCGSRVRILT